MANRVVPKPIRKITKKQTLGGSMFIRNAIEFDYCVAEALNSLCAVCDKVVILDANSTDGTLDLLKDVQSKQSNLRVISGANWECAQDFNRLRILANSAKNYLNTDWNFMLQADEVIHESSFPHIRKAMNDPNYNAYMIRRMNLWGDCNHYLKYDIPQEHKPVSDEVIRLATIEHEAHGDAESLQVNAKHLGRKVDEIVIFHYGFVRSKMIEKTLSMQSWFWGEGSQPDHRVVEMSKKENPRFEWEVMKTRDLLAPIPMSHPKFSQTWANERQKEKISLID